MRQPQYLTTAVTFLSFLSSSPVSWAQTSNNYSTTPTTSSTSTYQYAAGSDPTQNAVPSMNPFQLNMLQPQTTVQSKMAACQAQQLAGNSTLNSLLGKVLTGENSSSKTDDKSKKDDKGAGSCVADSFTCSTVCNPPTQTEYSCGDFYEKDPKAPTNLQTGIQLKRHIFKNGGKAEEVMQKDEKDLSTYISFLQYKKNNNCVSPAQKALDQAYQVYDCMMNALQDATGEATNQLKMALQQNNAQYGQMNTFVQQVGDQMRQIDQILGPADGGNGISKIGGDQFQGLLGMQKSLRQQMTEMNTKQADFQTRVQQVQKEKAQNDQTLAADQMGVVSSCMKGETDLGVSGGYSLMCYKQKTTTTKDSSGNSTDVAVTDSSGNPVYQKQSCGPMDYVQSQVEQAAFVNGNRGIIRDQKRRDQAADNVAEFKSMMTSIFRDLGDRDLPTSGGKLDPTMMDWSTISKKYSAQMADLASKTGVNITSEMNAIAGHCFANSVTWKNQQMNSASSTYSMNAQKIQQETNSLTADLNNGLSSVNQGYSAAMAVLGGQAVAISCPSTTDPTQMETCYENIRKNLQGLMDGTGANTGTVKNITGGSMLPGFSVSCKGIDGCVTAFQQVRNAKNEQIQTAQKAKVDFVQNSNSQIQTQLNSYTGYVASAEKIVMAQYTQMKAMLDKLGVSAPDAPNFMTPEALEATPPTPPDTAPGPYKMPADLSKALAGAMPAPGLINFADTGMSKFKDAANEKFKKDLDSLQDDIKTYGESYKKLADLSSSCTENDENGGLIAGRAGSDIGPSNCLAVTKACQDKSASVTGGDGSNAPISSDWVSSVLDLFNSRGAPSSTASDALNGHLKDMLASATDDGCRDALMSCENTVSAQYEKRSQTTDKGGTGSTNTGNNANGGGTVPQ